MGGIVRLFSSKLHWKWLYMSHNSLCSLYRNILVQLDSICAGVHPTIHHKIWSKPDICNGSIQCLEPGPLTCWDLLNIFTVNVQIFSWLIDAIKTNSFTCMWYSQLLKDSEFNEVIDWIVHFWLIRFWHNDVVRVIGVKVNNLWHCLLSHTCQLWVFELLNQTGLWHHHQQEQLTTYINLVFFNFCFALLRE